MKLFLNLRIIMPQLPVLSGKEMVRILQNLEFTITRINGSHFRLKHADGRITTIPVHEMKICQKDCSEKLSGKIWKWTSMNLFVFIIK